MPEPDELVEIDGEPPDRQTLSSDEARLELGRLRADAGERGARR